MFNAIQIQTVSGMLTNEVSVSSDTSWTCSVEGNFMLNTYEGSGDTTITVSALNDDDHTGHGKIIFIYSDGDCMERFECPIWYVERDWIRVTPNVEYFTRSLENEYKVFKVETGDDEWNVVAPSEFRYFKSNNNKLYLIKITSYDGVINIDTGVTDNHMTVIVNFEENE